MPIDLPESDINDEAFGRNLTDETAELLLRCNLMRRQLTTNLIGITGTTEPAQPAPTDTVPPGTVESSTVPLTTASAQPPASALPAPDWISKAQLKALLEIFRDELHANFADETIDATTAALLLLIPEHTESAISYRQWANLSLKLELLIKRISMLRIPPACTMTRAEFLRQNLVSLEKICHFAWLREARAQVVKIFAKEIESASVHNPAMLDITQHKIKVEAGTPLPFLKGSVEFGYQTSKYVNDEGYVMQTRSGSVTIGSKVSAWLASAEAKILGSTGPLKYCRTALDHAKYFFDDMLKENSELQLLQPYLSRAGAVGAESRNVIEIRDFESMQNDFLIQQEQIAQHLSLLLSTPYTVPATDAEPPLRPAFRSWQVCLCATAEKQARALIGTVSTKSGSVGGTLTFGMLQGNVTGEKVTKTTSAFRTRTLCELLKDVNLSATARQDLVSRLDQSCVPIWKNVMQFWDMEIGDQSPADIIVNLKKIVKHAARLHALCAKRHPGAEATLQRFHREYGAKDSAEMLGNMALLIADSYATVARQGADVTHEEKDAQLKALLDLEAALFHCGIPNARQILEKQAFGRQQYRYAQDEVNVQATVDAKVFTIGETQKVKYSQWHLGHYESFAAGDYVRVDYTIGADQEMNRQVLQSISDHFKVAIPGLETYFGTSVHLKQGTYSERFFRPSAFADQPYSRQYQRILAQESLQLGVSVPLPLPLPVSIQVDAGYSTSSTTMLSETPGSESLCYFARHFMHARQTNKTEASGKINQDSYFYHLEREQRGVFEALFINYANDRHQNGRLIRELDAIDQGLPIDQAGLILCRQARQRFLDCAERFRQARTLDNYDACLNQLKAMLNTYFPYWLKRRENSPVYGSWHVPLLG